MAHEFTLIAETLPANTCWTTPQDFLNLTTDYMTVNFDEPLSFFNFGSTTPNPDYQDRPWIKTDSNGFVDGLYVFSNGAWYKRHPLSPGIMTMFHDSASNIVTLDGGDEDNPYWVPCDGEEYTGYGNINGNSWTYTAPDFRSLMPLCAGQGTDPNYTDLDLTNRSYDSTGGEEQHVLQVTEIPEHTHPPIDGQQSFISSLANGNYPGSLTNTTTWSSTPSTTGSTGADISSNTASAPYAYGAHNNMPPFRVTNFIIRTPRIF